MKNPEIRFIDDNIDWQENSLGNMGKTFNGLTGKTKNNFGHGIAKYITYMNVYKNTIALSNEVDSIEIDNSQNQVIYGDILFTVSSETPEEVGLSSVWLYNENNVYLNSFCFGYRPSDNIDHKFMGYLLRSNSVRKKIILLAQGISRYNISKNKVMEIKISLPSLKIQKEISSLLFDIDQKISSQEILVQKLKDTKSALLIKMFPQENQSVPELRFDGFTNDWEQRKVSHITTSYSGGTPQVGNSEYYNGEIPFIRSGEIYDLQTELFITQKGLNNSSAKMVSQGDILYALYGATSGEVNRINFAGAINQAILAIIPNDNNNPDFLVEYFRKEKNNIISKYLQGGQGNLSAQIIKDLKIYVPSFEEQNKIGKCFSQINNLITLHQRKPFLCFLY